jgi:hypothetical protein
MTQLLCNFQRYFVISAVFFEQGKYEDCIKTCGEAIEIGRENKADFKVIAKSDEHFYLVRESWNMRIFVSGHCLEWETLT